MGDRRADIGVFVKAPDSPWQSLGRDVARGVFPDGVTLSTNEGGPDTASFSLRRKASAQWPDLVAFNQLKIEVGGMPVWGGRIWEAPLSDTGEDVISVQARGWQYHLDDDLLDEFWVQTQMTEWKNLHDHPDTNLTEVGTLPTVSVGAGVMTIGWPNSQAVPANTAGDRCGVYFDAGPNRRIKRVVFTYTGDGDNGNLQVYILESDTLPYDVTTATLINTLGSAVSGTVGRTLPTARRYVAIMGQNGTGAAIGPLGEEAWFKVTGAKLFVDAAYESGAASILKASDVARDLLASGALPLLSSDTSGIETKTFSIPDLSPDGYQTPRSILAAANAYEGDLVGVDLNRRLFFRERATVPVVEIGAWPGSQFNDSSTNSAEGLYNRVIVQGTGPDGEPIAEVRTATSSLLTRQGFTRTAVLSVSAPMTTTSAQKIGDIWLADKSLPKFKGTATVQGHGAARSINGGGIHPSELLLRGGDLLRVGHLIDPSNGAIGRDGVIKSVSYSHDTETATVELDSERGRFEALLERLAVVTTQAVR